MIKVFCFITLFVMGSCSDKYKVSIKNEDTKPFDSLVVTINFKTVAKVINLHDGFDTTISYSSEKLNTGHDVAIYCTVYDQGKVIDSFFVFNDLGYLPPHHKCYCI